MSETALRQEAVSGVENALAYARRRLRLQGEDATAQRVVCVAVAAYSMLFIFAAVVQYETFNFARGDLGNMVQTIWNTQHGHFLETTTLNGHQQSRLGFHADPFLVLFVPLFWIWSSPDLLLVVQVLAVSSGALPVFWLARKHLESSRAGAHFALAYLLYPAVQFNAYTSRVGFHSVSIAVPLILYAIWFLDEDRLVAFSAVALLACTTKEEIPLAVGCLGIWYAVRSGRRLFGFGVFVTGLAITLFDFLWVIPHFSITGDDPFSVRYRAVGGTPGGIGHTLFTDPAAFVHAVATWHKAGYLALLLVPFFGLWLLEPLLLLGAVPDLAINLLSSKSDQTAIPFHWTAGIVPFVVAASIFGAARFGRRGIGLSLAVLGAVVLTAVVSPVYTVANDVRALGSSLVSVKAKAVSLIPPGAAVSASNQIGGHLSERRYIATFPYVGRARWIVVDVNDPSYATVARFKPTIRAYEANKAWHTVLLSRGLVVLHR